MGNLVHPVHGVLVSRLVGYFRIDLVVGRFFQDFGFSYFKSGSLILRWKRGKDVEVIFTFVYETD